MARVVWSRHAREQLTTVRRHIERYDPPAAARLVGRLLSASRRLVRFPRSGRVVPEYQREDVREIIVNPYRLLYRIHTTGDIVEIVSIWHGARLHGDIPRL